MVTKCIFTKCNVIPTVSLCAFSLLSTDRVQTPSHLLCGGTLALSPHRLLLYPLQQVLGSPGSPDTPGLQAHGPLS